MMPADHNPMADRTKLQQLNTRIMVYCVYTLGGSLACPGGSSTSYSQCCVKLTTQCTTLVFIATGQALTTCTVHVPQSRDVTAPGDYHLTILDAGVPSEAVFVSIGP